VSKKQTKRRYWLAGHRHPAQDSFFKEALDSKIWEEGDSENWDSCWYTGMPDPDVFEQLDPTKSINHIPGNNGLTIKDFLHDTLAGCRGRLKSPKLKARMDFFPHVYSMPNEYHEWLQHAHEDPDHKWILKPKNSSRGRGIEVVRDLADVPLDKKFMVQDYLDNPHLINERKYVLRLYVLISSVEPLQVYLYDEGFAKLASDPYDLDDLDNPFAHLTNPDINALNDEADAPVVFINLGEYKKWLREQGHDDVALFDKVRDLVTITSISVRENMRNRTNNINATTNGCYELMGYDCFISNDLKPYLLECNLSPDLKVCSGPEDGGDIEHQVKSQVVKDMVSLLGLNLPPEDKLNMDIGARADAELSRSGQFSRLFPAPDTVEDYLSFFPVPRYADMVLALMPSQTSEIITNDELSLYYEKTGALYKPSELSGWIWLKTADGASPEDIAEELLAVHTASHGAPSEQDRWQIHNNVWNVLADWAQTGLLQQAEDDKEDTPRQSQDTPAITLSSKVYAGTKVVELDYGTPILRKTLEPLFRKAPSTAKADIVLNVQRTGNGYALAINSKLIAANISIGEIIDVIIHELFKQAVTTDHEIGLAGTWIPVSETQADFFLNHTESQQDAALSLLFSTELNTGFSGGAILNLETGTLAPIGLPIRIDDTSTDQNEPLKKLARSGVIQTKRDGGRGRRLSASNKADGQIYSLRRLYLDNSKVDGGEKKPASENAAHHDALAAVLAVAISKKGNLPSGTQVQKLNDWLGNKVSFVATGSDIMKTAKHLAS